MADIAPADPQDTVSLPELSRVLGPSVYRLANMISPSAFLPRRRNETRAVRLDRLPPEFQRRLAEYRKRGDDCG